MSTMRKIKTKMVENATSNPHRRRYLVKHSKVTSETDPKREARRWVASKADKRLVSKRTVRARLQKLLKETESAFHDDQSRYKAMKEQELNENRRTLQK